MADPEVVANLLKSLSEGESQGQDDPYRALGPRTKSGDRAYGKYQVMGSNIGPWAAEAGLGKVTPRQFLASPEIQDKIVGSRTGKLYDKYSGSVKDVGAEWHSGVNYDTAVKEKRIDPLKKTTKDYAEEFEARYNAKVPQNVVVDLPDGTSVNLGPNPTPELREQVKQKIRDKWPELQQTTTPTQPTSSTTTTTTSEGAKEIQADTIRTMPPSEASREVNRGYGLSDENPIGKYAVAFGKPVTDHLYDFAKGVETLKDPKTFMDSVIGISNVLSPLSIPGEAAGNAAFEFVMQTTKNPTLAAAAGTAVSIVMGAKSPVPWSKSFAARDMPLQGSRNLDAAAARAAGEAENVTATAAKEAEDVASRGEEWVKAQQGISKEATTAAEAESQAANKAATEAAGQAETAEAAVTPSPATTAEAQAAINPRGATAEGMGAGIKTALTSRLEDLKASAGATYDTAVTNAMADGKSLDPAKYQVLSKELSDVRAKLGSLTPSAEEAVSNLENKINSGLKVTPEDLNNYKRAIDVSYPGKFKAGEFVRDSLRSMFRKEDVPLVEAADALWRDELAGRGMTKSSLGMIVKALRQTDPEAVFEALFKGGTSDAAAPMFRSVLKHLEAQSPELAQDLRGAALSRFLGQADNPKDILKAWDTLNPTFKKELTSPGAETFFEDLRNRLSTAEATGEAEKTLGSAAEAAETRAKGIGKAEAAKVSEAQETANKATVEATKARDTAITGAQKASSEAAAAAKEPNKFAKFMAQGVKLPLIGATEYTLHKLGLGPLISTTGALGVAGAAELLIPTKSIATALANSKSANALARLMKTPANSAVIPTIIQELKKNRVFDNITQPEKSQNAA